MRRDKFEERKIALERILKLYALAEKGGKYETSYLKRAKEISKHYLVPLPLELKRKTCKKCFSLLRPGKNCIIRISRKLVIVKCGCGAVRKYGAK